MGGWFTRDRLVELAARTCRDGRCLKREDGKRVFNSWFLILTRIMHKIDVGDLEGYDRPRIECQKGELCNGQPWCCERKSHRIHVSSLAVMDKGLLGPVSSRLKTAAIHSVAAKKGWRNKRVA